jgi:PPOX class probable F420-dependent enzyme
MGAKPRRYSSNRAGGVKTAKFTQPDEINESEKDDVKTIPDTHKDLLKTDVAILATIGKGGYPQVTALWFLLDDDGLVRMSLNCTRQKVKNLLANPDCTLFILDRTNPLRTLEIRARAEITPDKEYIFADKVGKKYGVDLRKNERPGEYRYKVTLHPVRINAIDLSKG